MSGAVPGPGARGLPNEPAPADVLDAVLSRPGAADVLNAVLGLPAGERLDALARVLVALGRQDQAARTDHRALEEALKTRDRAEEARSKLELDLQRAQADAEKLKQRLGAEERENESLRKLLDSTRAADDDRRKAVDARDARVRALEEEKERLVVELHRQRSEKPPTAVDEERVKRLQRENQELKQTLARVEEDYTAQLAARGQELAALHGRAREAAAAGDDVPGWLWERLAQSPRLQVAATATPARGVVLRVLDGHDALAECVRDVDMSLRLFAGWRQPWPRIAAWMDALKEGSLDSVLTAGSNIRRLQVRLKTLSVLVRALAVGIPAVVSQDFVNKKLREHFKKLNPGRFTTVSAYIDGKSPEMFAAEFESAGMDKFEDVFLANEG